MKAAISAIAFALLIVAALTLRPDLGAQAVSPDATGRAAPEFQVSRQWINSPELHLSDLRGKVVLIDFWTYSCINCLRTIPYLNQWHERYQDRGLVVVGVHTPEFEFEGLRSNVEDAVRRLGIRYPVAQDNEYETWKRYDNIAWPAFYLIDREGKIVFMRYGEGGYDQMENRIRQLLGINDLVARDDGADLSKVRTSEIYFGTAHDDHQAPQASQREDFAADAFGGVPASYRLPGVVRAGEFAFAGRWSRRPDRASLLSESATIVLRFSAAKVHLVAGSAIGSDLVILVDGKVVNRVRVERPRMYTLFDSDDYREHTLQIEVSGAGFDAYSVTFG